MDRFADFILHHRKLIITAFLVVAGICAVLAMFVGVNYDMTDYLPPEAQSTRALDIMTEEFGGSMPNTSVMVKDVSVQEALQYKQDLALIEGVTDVMWLDDMIDLKQPLEMADADTVEGFYKDGDALFSVTLEEGMEPSRWKIYGRL
jgi:predicted RND superfamily exporter protein